jgi:hypothetical protein
LVVEAVICVSSTSGIIAYLSDTVNGINLL